MSPVGSGGARSIPFCHRLSSDASRNFRAKGSRSKQLPLVARDGPEDPPDLEGLNAAADIVGIANGRGLDARG